MTTLRLFYASVNLPMKPIIDYYREDTFKEFTSDAYRTLGFEASLHHQELLLPVLSIG